MLKFLRKKKNSKILLVVMAAIILVFMLWGIGGNKGGSADVIARVDGEEIMVEDFQKAYRRQEDYYRDTLKGALTDEFLKNLNLKQRTLDDLINRKLILNNAHNKRVKASNEEVSATIQAIAAFRKDGAFDKETYLTLLKRNRLFPGEFEDMMREDLLIKKMQDNVLESVAVTDEELKEAYKVENREVKLNYLAVDIADFEKKIKVTENDARAYLEKNKERFRIPAKIKAAYASIHFNDLLSNIKVSDKEIKDYYEKNAATFETPKEVRASHILILPSDKEKEKSWQGANDKALDILKKIKNGANFSKMAKQYSRDTGSAPMGGNLGFFRKGSMVKPFEDTAFSLKKGEISEPVKTTYGYHIIKVTDIREAGARPLKEVKKDIIEVVKNQKAKKLAREKIDTVRTPFKDGKPLDELEPIVTEEGLKFTVTDFFSSYERIDDIARYKDLRVMAFSMDANESSGPIELPHGIYVMRIAERVDAHLADYSEVTDDVTEALRKEMAETEAKSRADLILKRLKDGDKMRTLAKKEGLKLEVSGFTTQKQGYITKEKLYIGNRKDIFLLTKDSPYFNETIKSGAKFYILKLKDSKEPKEEEFEKTKDSIKERLFQEKQGKTMTDWINKLRTAAVVEVNQDLLNR